MRIGGSTYVPFEDQRKLEFQIQEISSIAGRIVDPFEQSLFLLAHISYIQAFADVNKRTARLAANIPLITKNLVPLSFSDVEVSDYMSAMIAIYELQDIRPLIDLYVYSYIRTCAAYDSTVKALGFDEVRVRCRRQRREVIRKVLSQQLLGTILSDFIQVSALNDISEKDRFAFVEDVLEDLDQIDESRLVGLGVTLDQLKAWLILRG